MYAPFRDATGEAKGVIRPPIYRPSVAPSIDKTASAVLICLPRGPLLADQPHDSTALSHLRDQKFPFPIVQLNYRLGRDHLYPTPVHDVLRGYDWIKDHLLPKRAIYRTGRPEQVGRVGICGEFIGGGLAAMLALTECRVGQPGIVAAALGNPIVDWVDFDADRSVPASGAANEKVLAGQLPALRRRLFRKSEHYFDPFASPMLFLRSAGRDVPPAPPDAPLDDMEHLTLLNREELRHVTAQVPESTPEKKTAKRYPSPTLGLRLPAFHISAGRTSPLRGQAEEFTRRLRQAHLRQVGEADSGRKVLTEDEVDNLDEGEKLELARREGEARRKTQLRVHRDLDLWDDSVAGKTRVGEVANWLKNALD